MKNKLHITVVVFLTCIFLVMAAFPASADAIKTEVTGELYPLTSSEPVEKSWEGGQYVYHWRIELIELQYVTTDDRLDGYAQIINNGDSHYAPDGTHQFTHVWAKWTIYAEHEFLTPKWNCTNQGEFDADWNFYAEGVCQGAGENKGLVAKFSHSITDWSLGYMVLKAVIIDPGGK
jgi:hypothetical protein